MKAIAVIAALLVSGTANALDKECLAAAVLHTADWMQTRQLAKHPDWYWESNHILGRHPSLGRVNTYFITTGALLYTACETGFGGDWLKYGWIAIEAGTVATNLRIGLQVKW